MSRSRKIVMMLVALLGAVLLWLYVVTFVTPEFTKRVNSIPININGVKYLRDNDLLITEQDVNTLAVEFSTSRVNLSKLSADTISVTADASWIEEPGVYELDCAVKFPDPISSDVVMIKQKPETVTVTVTKLERKTIPEITLKWGGAVKEGYLLDTAKAVFDPAEITISGPEFDVSQVAQAVVYFEDVSNLEETVVETLPVVFLNEAGEEVVFTSEATQVSDTEVTMTLPVYRTKELTLAMDTVEGGGIKNENVEITIEPRTIRVKGSAEDIDQLEDVYLLDTLDLAVLDDEKQKEDRIFSLNLPAGVSIVSSETEAVVTIQITGVTRDTVNVTDIRLVNPPTDYDYQTFTNSARVTIRGSTKDIREIKKNSAAGIRIEVDLTEYTDTGVYLIPGNVISEKYPDIGVIGTVEIGVVVSVPEPETEEPTEDEG